jgi:hypothetical protein
MKKILFFALFLTTLTFLQSKAQILTPVHWSYGSKKISPTEAVVFLKATIDDGWHMYSQTVKDGGPVKTTITFTPSKDYSTIGTTVEPKPITRMEKVFSMEVGFFESSVVFQQKIKLKASQTIVKGTLEYMTCNDHQCLPPEDIEFSIPVK